MKYSQERKPSAELRPKQAVLARLAPIPRAGRHGTSSPR